MTLFDEDGSWSVPAQAREVFDVSGAGDTVISVLGVMLAAGTTGALQSPFPTEPAVLLLEN